MNDKMGGLEECPGLNNSGAALGFNAHWNFQCRIGAGNGHRVTCRLYLYTRNPARSEGACDKCRNASSRSRAIMFSTITATARSLSLTPQPIRAADRRLSCRFRRREPTLRPILRDSFQGLRAFSSPVFDDILMTSPRRNAYWPKGSPPISSISRNACVRHLVEGDHRL